MSERTDATPETAIDVLLTREQLLFLGRYAAVAASPCSPFFGDAGTDALPQPALEDLFRRGLLHPQGVEPRLLSALALLKGADTFGGIEVRADRPQAEAVCYFSAEGSCALHSHARGLRVVSPASAASFDALLREAFGAGSRRAIDLALDLPASDSRVLAAALDLMRRDALARLIDAKPEPLREERLVAWLARRDLEAPWLTRHLALLLDRRGLVFDLGAVRGASEGLLARGLLTRDGKGQLSATASLRPLVRHLLLLDRVVELRAGRAVPGGPLVRVDILVAKATSPTLLLLEPHGFGFVHWTVPSAAAARRLAASLLGDGTALDPITEALSA
jgi:hypothetical protein